MNSPETAVITGVSSGLGKAMAQYFRSQGVRVIGVSRTPPEIELDLWIRADVTLEADRQRVLAESLRFSSRIDLLLNNAGKGIYATWEEMTLEELQEVYALDFFAVVALAKAFLPVLKESRGSLINISSMAGQLWVPCMGGYCAVKSSVAMFSDSLRPELRRYGVHVLDVRPGQISTGFSSRSIGSRKPPQAPGAKSDPRGFAKAVFKAWKHRRRVLYYPSIGKLAISLIRNWIPGLYDRINIRLWNLK